MGDDDDDSPLPEGHPEFFKPQPDDDMVLFCLAFLLFVLQLPQGLVLVVFPHLFRQFVATVHTCNGMVS